MKQIIMMHGLPLSGKSYCANKLKMRIGGVRVIKSVLTRFKEEEQVRFTKNSIDETVEKTRKEKDRSYVAMIEILQQTIGDNYIPVLDATFHKRYRRELVCKFCRDNNISLVIMSMNFDNIAKINEMLDKRKEKFQCKDSVLNDIEQYDTMKSQAEEISPEEIEKNNLAVIWVDRVRKKIKSNKQDKFIDQIKEAIRCSLNQDT